MEDKILERHEVEKEYKWDLGKMFSSPQAWEEECNDVVKRFSNIEKYKGKIMDSSDNLYELLEIYFELSRRLENLYVYASMKKDEDTTNSSSQTLKGKIENLFMNFEEISSFIIPEILRNDYSVVQKFL